MAVSARPCGETGVHVGLALVQISPEAMNVKLGPSGDEEAGHGRERLEPGLDLGDDGDRLGADRADGREQRDEDEESDAHGQTKAHVGARHAGC